MSGSLRGRRTDGSATAVITTILKPLSSAPDAGGWADRSNAWTAAAHYAIDAGKDRSTSVFRAVKPGPPQSSTTTVHAATTATTVTGDQTGPAADVAESGRSAALRPVINLISATAATADLTGSAHAAAGSVPAPGSVPARRSATPAMPAMNARGLPASAAGEAVRHRCIGLSGRSACRATRRSCGRRTSAARAGLSSR